jgi:hypothetical protein
MPDGKRSRLLIYALPVIAMAIAVYFLFPWAQQKWLIARH